MGAKTRILLTVLAMLALAAVGFGAVGLAGEANRITTRSQDVSGPCDEAEHANDPRCAGQVVPSPEATRSPDDDVSGPCDEAEHANDPRCTGEGTVEDNGGPGRVDQDDDDGDAEDADDDSGHGSDEDRSGSNSGRG